MRLAICRAEGTVGVDGVFRAIDLSDLDVSIRVIQFDDAAGVGAIEYEESATVPIQTRDHELEAQEAAAAGSDRDKHARLQVRMKTINVPRAPMRISSLGEFQKYVGLWNAAAPPPPPLPTPEELRAQANALILVQIERLERTQARAVREMLLDEDPTAKTRLEAIDAEISALRTQLQ